MLLPLHWRFPACQHQPVHDTPATLAFFLFLKQTSFQGFALNLSWIFPCLAPSQDSRCRSGSIFHAGAEGHALDKSFWMILPPARVPSRCLLSTTVHLTSYYFQVHLLHSVLISCPSPLGSRISAPREHRLLSILFTASSPEPSINKSLSTCLEYLAS